MSKRTMYLQTCQVMAHERGANLTDPAAWDDAVGLGDLKGKPFVKVTYEPKLIDTQGGKSQEGVTGKFELTSLEVDPTQRAALQAMVSQNTSLRCVPLGTVTENNPVLIIKNFLLCKGGDVSVGEVWSVKLSGEKEAPDETEIFVEVVPQS